MTSPSFSAKHAPNWKLYQELETSIRYRYLFYTMCPKTLRWAVVEKVYFDSTLDRYRPIWNSPDSSNADQQYKISSKSVKHTWFVFWKSCVQFPVKRPTILIVVFYEKSEVLTAVKMSMLVFWVVTPCGLVGRHQRFHLQPRRYTTYTSTRRYNPEDQNQRGYLWFSAVSTGIVPYNRPRLIPSTSFQVHYR
jgi:hypothetical protein